MKFKFWDLNLYQFDISLVSVFTFYLYQNRVVLNPESDIGKIWLEKMCKIPYLYVVSVLPLPVHWLGERWWGGEKRLPGIPGCQVWIRTPVYSHDCVLLAWVKTTLSLNALLMNMQLKSDANFGVYILFKLFFSLPRGFLLFLNISGLNQKYVIDIEFI